MRCITAMLMLTMFLAGCDRSDENKSAADQRNEEPYEITLKVEVDAPGINVDFYCDDTVRASGVTRNGKVPQGEDELSTKNQTAYVTDLRAPIRRGTHLLKIKAVGYNEWEKPHEAVGDSHFDVKLMKEGSLVSERD